MSSTDGSHNMYYSSGVRYGDYFRHHHPPASATTMGGGGGGGMYGMNTTAGGSAAGGSASSTRYAHWFYFSPKPFQKIELPQTKWKTTADIIFCHSFSCSFNMVLEIFLWSVTSKYLDMEAFIGSWRNLTNWKVVYGAKNKMKASKTKQEKLVPINGVWRSLCAILFRVKCLERCAIYPFLKNIVEREKHWVNTWHDPTVPGGRGVATSMRVVVVEGVRVTSGIEWPLLPTWRTTQHYPLPRQGDQGG